MHRLISRFPLSNITRLTTIFLLALTMFCAAQYGKAQTTPLISGGAGFFTSTRGGDTTYQPIIEPLIDVPVGSRFLIESRAALGDAIFPNGKGYDHSRFIALTYLEGDYFLTPHITVVGGSFLIPFNTYNDRLSPIWIGNFQDGPLITGIGDMTGTGVGGMLSGSAIARKNYSISYNAWFSARSGNTQFSATRGSGGRVSLYLPEERLEMGLSYDRQLQGTHENFYGAHLWWEPANTGFRLRSEFARGHHAQGYWAEADYRMQAFGGPDSWIGRFQPAFRMQQTFRRDTFASDGVPLVNTQRADFGLNYNLPHNTRILTSYSRQFSSTSNENIWETGIVYRFLFPAWKGKSQ